MTVTNAIPADVAELTLLVNTAYRGERSRKGWATEAHLLDGARIDEETMAGYFTYPAITILKNTDAHGAITACVYLENKGDKLYLGMLSVMPELQAAGIGRLLLQEAERIAQTLGLAIINITVITQRLSLIDWYQRRGYVPTGEILPFHVDKKFGVPNTHIELMVLEKHL
jgi:GNAT superfamily N-acetyltransferase